MNGCLWDALTALIILGLFFLATYMDKVKDAPREVTEPILWAALGLGLVWSVCLMLRGYWGSRRPPTE